MFLVHLIQFFIGGTPLVPTNTDAVVNQSPTPVALEEILSYECARNVAGLVERGPQPGPLFAEGGLVFASTETLRGGRVLMVSAGSGTFAVKLNSESVNRVRFSIPAQDSRQPKTFFVSYLHDGVFRSRYFDFGVGKPPAGRDELDYHWAAAKRADYMLPNLEYAIYQTTQNALNALTDGILSRHQLARRKVASCEYISRKTPGLARILQHNLDVLELMVIGVPAGSPATNLRSPASAKPR